MSLRGTKRASGVRSEETGKCKRRRTEPEDALWQLPPVSDLKMSSIYNRSAPEAPAELFRKDLISAMKLPDSEPLTPSEYWIITDTWKQDWERGVQVPVNPESLPAPKVKVIENPLPSNFEEFKLPKDKYIHLSRDANYQTEKHHLSATPALAEAACSYDLDATDTAWLKLLNAERARAGACAVTEDQLEKVIEDLEIRTWDKIQAIMKSEEGLGIEYDENVICDVCRSPDSEDGNEMVFCDSCNICVHQACYGITVIPDGQWLCRPCGAGVRPTCALCPNLGGAMKCTPNGHKWAHVSCVLWIPEVSIGCAEKMEPITKISSIPPSRWSLVCVLCRERKGACIQCSVKTCKTAYHVTCAFKHGLEMRAIIEDENADDGVKLRSYCQKHSVNSKKDKCPGSGSEEEEVKRKRRKDMTSEEKTQARAARLQEIEREFDRHVSVKDISSHLLDVDQDAIHYIYNYWKLKRRACHNRPLLPPKSDDSELLTHRQEQADLDKMKMFVQLRQDLERVRNLCYMVSRREKLSRSFFRMREQTFHKQVAVLSSEPGLSGVELAAILEANHGPSIYDRLYSHPNALDHKNDFDELLARIAPQDSSDDKKKDRNGLVKGQKAANPYKKHYVNGSRRSESMYSGLSSEESAPENNRATKYRGRTIASSTDEDVKKPSSSPKKKISPKGKGKRSPKKPERKKKKIPQSKAVVESSSDDESYKMSVKKDKSRSKTLQQMEKEMDAGKSGLSGTDSGDLMPMRSTRNSKFPIDIYSDTSDDTDSAKTDHKSQKVKQDKGKTIRSRSEGSPSGIDSQQGLPRTKAAMKEFVSSHSEKKSSSEEKPAPKKRGRKPSNKEKKSSTPVKTHESDDEARNKENIKLSKQKDNPSDLIVPQRQAAKKASENMRSTTVAKREESSTDKQASGDESRSKSKSKTKGKDNAAKSSTKKSSKDVEKEPIAYVPQRQAAKKAAAHIKSGLGSKLPVIDPSDSDKRKDIDKSDTTKSPPKKNEAKCSKASANDTSSSTSNTSSSSYSSSSSSEEEQEKPTMKPSAKAREIKPISRQPSMFSPPGSRPTVDLPFLDKVSRPLSSTSASSDSDTTKGSRFSGSESPSPKRPRRPRRGKSFSSDAQPRKAPNKKLKTSERGSECRLSSPSIEREKSVRLDDAHAPTRSRTRSVTTSGNMSNKCDARQRKPSKDDIFVASGSNQNPEETCKSRKLSVAEREEDEKIKDEMKEETYVATEMVKNDVKVSSRDITRRSVSVEEKQKPIPIDTESCTIIKSSPRKSMDVKQKNIISRRMSVKSYPFKDTSIKLDGPCETITKPTRRASQSFVHTDHSSFSLNTKVEVEIPPFIENVEKKVPSTLSDDFATTDKHWLPKATSPHIHPPPVEKPGGHEKYMTEDKSFDSDCTDKSSIKMIAKIQANLNENTMIKSPKTPMDARTINLDPMEENSLPRNLRKRSTTEPEKKFIVQDVSHVQGVEISKSAKIPSAANPFPNRSMFSPQSKDTELFEFDILDNEGFNHEDIMKPFTTYPEFLFKEDSKEQGVQETLNLVDRLRMQLSTKKAAPENVPREEEINVSDDKEHTDEGENRTAVDTDKEQEHMILEQTMPTEHHDVRSPMNEIHHTNNKQCSTDNVGHQDDVVEIVDDKEEESEHLAKENWSDMSVPAAQNDPQVEPVERTYGHTMSYTENVKERSLIHSDVQSISEVADSISLSKQSDDSQSLSVVDQSLHSNDQELSQDNQVYDNNNSLMHSDCATISPPYVNQNSKWRESKITTRRSSDSSTNSEGSVCSRKADLKSHLNSCDSHSGAMMADIDQYTSVPAYSCSVEPPMPLNQYTNYAPDASPFLNSMSTLPLFAAGACASSQLPLPSPGRGLYPPGLSFTAAPLIQPLTKPPFPLCAAFTTSSQNIALTTAMIAPPTPKPLDSPRDDIDVTGSDKFSIHVSSPTISVDSYNETSNTRPPTKMSNDSNETMSSLHPQESKSPPKTSKPTPKFSSKSPGKSPGISPKQSDSKGSKRTSNRSNRSQRGRGRSKSRGQSVHAFPSTEFTENSIQSKLVGTVYDFDEELANDGVDLKALRERRKSVDIRDNRKSEHSYKDTSQSPKVLSPAQSKKPATEVKEIEPSIDVENSPGSPSSKSNSETGPGFSQVAPVLPGPVDMRTYQNVDTPAPPANDGIHSHLLAFASGTAEQPLVEIDEEVEKQLHSELMASKPRQATSTEVTTSEVIQEPIKETPQLPKVSLSDSRNQLKVKIKGPFLDANYSTSSTQPAAPQPPAPVHDSNINSNTTSGSANTMMTGSTNLRRMRKKELLRQYWTQDMNMDDPANASNAGIPPPPAVPQPIPRTVITIPKAVASMTSIPTREDYKIIDTPVEKKKRKVSGVNRELRHLEVTMNDDVDTSDDMKLSNYTTNTTQNHKRRGRVAIKQSKSRATSPVAPKLKIKIGSNTVQQVNDEPTGFQFRPPKKRLTCSIPKPSLEDLRRESMKYRRMVMADFEENEKEKKLKLNKSEKRKKKKGKKLEKEKLQVINSDNDSATKLIIKIKRKKEEDEKSGSDEAGPSAALVVSEPPVDPFEYDPTAPDPLAIDPPCNSASGAGVRKVRTSKVTPIRLKLARSSQGSGYVMKETVEEASSTAPASSEVSTASAASATLSVSHNKHCEVR